MQEIPAVSLEIWSLEGKKENRHEKDVLMGSACSSIPMLVARPYLHCPSTKSCPLPWVSACPAVKGKVNIVSELLGPDVRE